MVTTSGQLVMGAGPGGQHVLEHFFCCWPSLML